MTKAIVKRKEGKFTVVTAAGVRLAKAMAEGGFPIMGIAARLGIPWSTFKGVRKRQPELDDVISLGYAEMEGELVTLLLEGARNGNFSCAMFLLKARAGYRDAGPQTPNTDKGPTINITIPPPLTAKQLKDLYGAGAVEETKTIDEDGKVIRS